MFTLSFINLNIFYQIYDIHHCLQRLLGFLILFIINAFVSQRQFLHRGLPSPLSVLKVSKNFIATLIILNLPLIYENSSLIIINKIKVIKLSIYSLNLLKMNNTCLSCLTATAGTRFSQDI
jgi:hypothetical protein